MAGEQLTVREREQKAEIDQLREQLAKAEQHGAALSATAASTAVTHQGALAASQQETQDARDDANALRQAAVEAASVHKAALEAGWADLASSEALNAQLEQLVAERMAENERMQATLVQSQKMEAVGQLTGGLAHDFNNMLTAIMGSLELLQNRLAQGRVNQLDHLITSAQGAAKRAAILTHRLLAFSRRQTLDPKPTDINRLIMGMEELVRRTAGIGIAVEVAAAGGLWTTQVDPHQLENALLNLCNNARDAMPDGGKLTIETANRWLDQTGGRERDIPAGQYVSLCVSDTGTGMSPEIAAQAFDPFFTTKPIGQGTGLGLSMIYGFVRQSGGQVRIYSEVGKGTMVCLYLPRHYEAATMVEDVTSAPEDIPQGTARETVLMVDDEPAIRMLACEVLTDLGYACIEAADGAAALKIVRSTTPLDLLITDIGLPHNFNGRQLAEAARGHRPDLKVLFITGYAENAVVHRGLLAADMHMMMKPFALERFTSRIREIMTASPPKPDNET